MVRRLRNLLECSNHCRGNVKLPYRCSQNAEESENDIKHLLYIFVCYSLLLYIHANQLGILLQLRYISFKLRDVNSLSRFSLRFCNLKPIFHRKLGWRWVPNANEIYTKNMKCTCSTRKCCVGTQRNLYSTGNC